MEYIVKVGFNDLLDNEYRYEAGDIYPREGITPTKERIDELSTENNKRGIVLIAAVKNTPKETAKDKKNAKEDTKGTDDKPGKAIKKKPS